MALMEWDDSLSVGFEEIDEDHKKLIELLNQLNDSVAADQGDAVVAEVLDGLLGYTSWHFRHEERLMQTYGYQEFPNHKQEHGELLETALTLNKEFQDGASDVPGKMLPFVKDWLTNHILGTDRKLGAFLASKV